MASNSFLNAVNGKRIATNLCREKYGFWQAQTFVLKGPKQLAETMYYEMFQIRVPENTDYS